MTLTSITATDDLNDSTRLMVTEDNSTELPAITVKVTKKAKGNKKTTKQAKGKIVEGQKTDAVKSKLLTEEEPMESIERLDNSVGEIDSSDEQDNRVMKSTSPRGRKAAVPTNKVGGEGSADRPTVHQRSDLDRSEKGNPKSAFSVDSDVEGSGDEAAVATVTEKRPVRDDFRNTYSTIVIF